MLTTVEILELLEARSNYSKLLSKKSFVSFATFLNYFSKDDQKKITKNAMFAYDSFLKKKQLQIDTERVTEILNQRSKCQQYLNSTQQKIHFRNPKQLVILSSNKCAKEAPHSRLYSVFSQMGILAYKAIKSATSFVTLSQNINLSNYSWTLSSELRNSFDAFESARKELTKHQRFCVSYLKTKASKKEKMLLTSMAFRSVALKDDRINASIKLALIFLSNMSAAFRKHTGNFVKR